MPPELVVFVGLQGAGKTSFYRAHFADSHDLVSKDHFPNNRRSVLGQPQDNGPPDTPRCPVTTASFPSTPLPS